jgi:hypothetical protein
MCSKLDVKSTKLVFVGYITTSKGYKLWEPNTKKVRKIVDVIFDETFTYNSFAPIPAHSTKLLQVGIERTLTLARVAQLHIVGVVGAMQTPNSGRNATSNNRSKTTSYRRSITTSYCGSSYTTSCIVK